MLHVIKRRILSSVIVIFFTSFGSHLSWSQNTTANIRPILRLEKPKYLLGEAIRFWVGVSPGRPVPILPESRTPCSLSITKPDGTTKIESVDWPRDGDPSWGWEGGSGLDTEQAEVGSYTLVFECSGKKTKPVQLIVEKNEIIDQVTAQFRFEQSSTTRMGASIPAVLTVQNNSPYTIRFQQRGSGEESISISVVRDEPRMHFDFFYPLEKLSPSDLTFERYTWDIADKVSSITLKSGEQFEQHLTLEDAYRFDQPGDYEVVFSTVLSLLIGEKNGAFSDSCPLRLPVIGRQKFKVIQAE